MRKIYFLFTLVSILATVVVACGSEPSTTSSSAAKAASSNPVADAADFSVPVVRNVHGSMQSSEFTLAANRGKSTVLYFSFAG